MYCTTHYLQYIVSDHDGGWLSLHYAANHCSCSVSGNVPNFWSSMTIFISVKFSVDVM